MKKMKRLLMLFTLALSLVAPVAVPTTTPAIGILGTAEPVSAAVRLNRNKITLFKGQAKKLAITGTAKPVKWSSNNKSVAVVDKKGKVTGRKEGTAVITAKVSKKKYTCKVTVKNYAGLTKKCFRIEVGESLMLGMDGNWKSSDPKIAEVSKSGLIQAVSPGMCEVSATVKYHRYIYIIKVPEPITENISSPTPIPTTVTTLTPTQAITNTPIPTQAITGTPKPIVTSTPAPTLIVTGIPKPTLTVTATPTPVPIITSTPKPVVTNTPWPTQIITSTPKPTQIVTATPRPTQTITNTPTPAPSYVWLSATGEKYHKISNCGRMDPAKATLVTLSEAVKRGYPPCDKCF